MSLLFALLSIFTIYTERTFRTDCAVEVYASPEIGNIVIDSIIVDFRTNPENLFSWAFNGAGKQDDKEKDAFLIDYKSTYYDPKMNYGRAIIDVIVPKVKTFKNISLEGKVVDEIENSFVFDKNFEIDKFPLEEITTYSRHVFIDATYSGNLIKEAYGNLYIIPISENKCIYYMDMNIRFGWFFDIFISKKVYKNTMEWRIEQYMKNLKSTAESLK